MYDTNMMTSQHGTSETMRSESAIPARAIASLTGAGSMLHVLGQEAQTIAWRARHLMWLSARTQPALFYALAERRGFGRHQLVGPETELVIEGYPRSANSYAVIGLQLAQSRPRQIAHHTHAPAQVILAAQRGLPLLVPIRHPRDAVASLLIRDPRYSVDLALRAYASFYEAVLPYADRMVLAPFDDLTRDLGGVIRTVNRRFGTDFDAPSADPEHTAATFRLIEEIDAQTGGGEHTVARPSTWRREYRQTILRQVQAASRYSDILGLYERAVAPRPVTMPRGSRVIVLSAATG